MRKFFSTQEFAYILGAKKFLKTWSPNQLPGVMFKMKNKRLAFVQVQSDRGGNKRKAGFRE